MRIQAINPLAYIYARIWPAPYIGKFGIYEVRDREVAGLEYDFRFLEKSAATS